MYINNPFVACCLLLASLRTSRFARHVWTELCALTLAYSTITCYTTNYRKALKIRNNKRPYTLPIDLVATILGVSAHGSTASTYDPIG